MSAIAELKKAKEHSDKRQYGSKHQIIKKMMQEDPDAFYIDSDDGKGIVGVTHKKTGFRFHMPAGKVVPGLRKAGNLGGAVDKLARGVGKATAVSPELKAALHKLMDYNFVDPANRGTNTAVMALAGQQAGAVTGALSDDQAVGRDSLLGALAGALAGRYGPRAAQLGIGRVLTNVLDPYDYKGAPAKMMRSIKQDPMGVLKAIIKDKPHYHPTISGTDDIATVRELPHRAMFGMKPRAGQDTYTRKADGSFSFSDSISGKAMQDEIIEPIVPGYHTGVLGNYYRTELPDGSIGYKDRWDVDLQTGEKPWGSTSNALRWVLSKFTNPVTIDGVVAAPPKASAAFADLVSPQPSAPSAEDAVSALRQAVEREAARRPSIYTGDTSSRKQVDDMPIQLQSLW